MPNLKVVFKYHTIHKIIIFLGLFDFMTSFEEDRYNNQEYLVF
jgi:hypothetical protein